MSKLDDDIDRRDDDDGEELKPKIDKKKVLIFAIPLLVVIAVIVSIFTIFGKENTEAEDTNFHIVTKPGSEGQADYSVIFYDIPEISVQIKNSMGTAETLRIKITVEISNIKDVPALNALNAKINDIIISHTIELTPEEIRGINGLYYLKEELLYRLNMVTDPIKINDLNFKTFEIQTKE